MILSLWVKELIDEAYEEGWKKGLAEAQAQQLAEIRKFGCTDLEASVVKRMLKRGRSIQEIVEDTGVSEAEVRKLAEGK